MSSGCGCEAVRPPNEGDIPAGVNMPKKKDPRLRQLQAPPSKEFFDSADYEIQRHQLQQQQKVKRQHASVSEGS